MSFTIYPAIDLRGGNVVRLKQGDLARITFYSDDPEETALRWLNAGAYWLHIINLDGAFGEDDDANRSALQRILQVAKRFEARVQFGGGARSLAAIEDALKLGVGRVILGTIATEQPDVVANALTRFGPERIAVAIDARHGRVRVRGWKDDSAISAADLALQMRNLGLRTVIFTDVSRDGLGSGLNIASARELADVGGLHVIASGGAQTLQDLKAALDAKLAGVILGRALYEGTIDLKEVLNVSESTSPDVA